MLVGVAHLPSPLKYCACAPAAGAGTNPVPPAADELAALNTEYVVSVSCVVIVPVVLLPLVKVIVLPLTLKDFIYVLVIV